MRVRYPEQIDIIPMELTRGEKNASSSHQYLEYIDLLYILIELEKKVGANQSRSNTSHDYRIRLLETLSANNSRAGEIECTTNATFPLTIYPAVTTLKYNIHAYVETTEGLFIPAYMVRASRAFDSVNIDVPADGTLIWSLQSHTS